MFFLIVAGIFGGLRLGDVREGLGDMFGFSFTDVERCCGSNAGGFKSSCF